MTFSFSSRRSGASPFLKRPRTIRTSRHGIALLAVLACVVLLTIFVVSYISFMSLNRNATVQYSATVQAQEIAQGGLQDVLQDIHQEIIAGSVAATNAATFTVNGEMAYIPCTNYAAAPARAGYPTGVNGTPSGTSSWGTNATPTTFSPTLIRVSRRSSTSGGTTYNPIPRTSAYPGAFPLNRASAASTLTASANGRYITAARWNKPLLLAPYASALPTPFTTVTANTSTAAAGVPDWVYVTRTGSRVCTDADLAATPGLKPSSDPTTSYGTAAVGANPPVSPVVGRYAFIMYDEGALLDANVAGYPSGAGPPLVSTPADATTGQTQAVNGKSYAAYADLTQLPGLTTTIINNLIQYRNASVGSSANNYLLALISYAKTGFLNFFSPSGTVPFVGSSSDAPFLSRQDLINYFAKIDSNINTDSATFAQALPYLGTFSRASSAPSWEPGADVSTVLAANPQFANSAYTPANSSLYNYRSNAASPTQTPFSSSSPNPNPAIANVRFTAGGTITHYNDDASTTSYTVSAGDPLMQRRFSLARINWLSKADPTNSASDPGATYDKAIKDCFGLQWGAVNAASNNGNPCWNYVGSTGSTFNHTIETLTQVAAEGREPNFFEVLKAGILNGSIGLSAGPSNGVGPPAVVGPYQTWPNGGQTPGVSGRYAYQFPNGHPAPASVSDMQIMQIGANIIDQYDADSYPTAIRFDYDATNTASYESQYGTLNFGPLNMVYGDEDLPYLSGLYSIISSPKSSGTELDGWFQPEVWNPHQPPNLNNSPNYLAATPMNFQIRAYGSAYLAWSGQYWSGGTAKQGGGVNVPPATEQTGSGISTPPVNYWPAGDTNTGTISFTDAFPSTSALFDHPYCMMSGGNNKIRGVTVSSSGPHNTANPADPGNSYYSNPGTLDSYGNPAGVDHNGNPFVAFWTGEASYNILKDNYPSVVYDPGSTDGSGVIGLYYNSPNVTPLTICLGWMDSSNNFHPYSYMTGLNTYGCHYMYAGPSASPDIWEGNDDGDAEDGSRYQHYDPRTDRFSVMIDFNGGASVLRNRTARYDPANVYPGWGSQGSGVGLPSASQFHNLTSGIIYSESWLENANSASAPVSAPWWGKMYYADPDGVVRPGDGYLAAVNDPNVTTTGNGQFLFHDNNSGSNTNKMAQIAGGALGRRPVVLNRPFRSVGELGYTYRDEPFKTLDFSTPNNVSADAGLLDLFSITDDPVVVAGRVNMNNAPEPVIAALLSGGSKEDLISTYNMSGTDVTALAPNLAATLNPTAGQNPITNRADLLTSIYTAATASPNPGLPNTADRSNKTYYEAPIRALSNLTDTRTWNLMIDVIAQSGHMTSTATSLDDFLVQGEKRYWLHVAIDRYTGKIVAEQLEPVYE